MAADRYSDEDFAAFREAMDASPVEAVIIHAVYLINCATKDGSCARSRSTSLTHALRIGDGIGAAGVVLHPGAQKGEPLGPSMKRAAKVIAEALEETERCPLLLEQTAGHKGLLGRDFDETAELIEPPGAASGSASASTPATSSSRATTSPTPSTSARVLDEADAKVGLERLRLRPRQRRRGAARLLPRPPRQHRQGRDGQARASRPSSPSRASRACRRPWRRPGPKKKRPDRKEVAAAKRLREGGLKRRARPLAR